MTVFQ